VQVLPSPVWRRWESDRIRPSSANPNYCRSCFDALPTATYELDVGILFVDLRGFTAWSESRGSRQAADLVTRFYATSNRALTVDDALIDFIGDQVMASTSWTCRRSG
jgi:adenylate cyclase